MSVKSFAIPAFVCLVSIAAWQLTEFVHAKKPQQPPGGGGGEAPYRLIDLGGFNAGDGIQSSAKDINNPDVDGLLQVVGDSYASVPGGSRNHAAVWDVTAEGLVLDLTDISPPDYQKSTAEEINDLGQVEVGDYIWMAGQGLLTLPGLGSGRGDPGLLNDQGDIIGNAADADGVMHIASWHIDQNGQITGPVDLGSEDDLPPDFGVFDMNNHGVMAGYVGVEAAIIWFDADKNFQFQLLGGGGEAVAINDNNMVVGTAINSDGHWEAFLWTADTGMVGLGSLGGNESWATDINNRGQVVGWSDKFVRFSRVAFLWQDGQMFDLNQITDGADGKHWLQRANAINDAGHIVGVLRITKPVSEQHAFLLAPTIPPAE
jgi:probable HAF family extracellular repeat protein